MNSKDKTYAIGAYATVLLRDIEDNAVDALTPEEFYEKLRAAADEWNML